MATYVALLRGINVGRAKRVAMADLRKLVGELGHSNVRTLLNSGNVVFEASRQTPSRIASEMEAAIEQSAGFSASVIVVTATDLDRIVEDNPLTDVATDPSKLLVAFVSKPAELKKASPLVGTKWGSDALALGKKSAYLWCAGGILESKLAKEFGRAMGTATTTRNWATVLKLQAMTGSRGAG